MKLGPWRRGTGTALASRGKPVPSQIGPAAACPEAVGMALNSAAGRTQNQLHIHLNCVRPEMRERYGSTTS